MMDNETIFYTIYLVAIVTGLRFLHEGIGRSLQIENIDDVYVCR